jgi:hypothetical protein
MIMSKILDIIKEKAVLPEIQNNKSSIIGEVIEYNKDRNMAKVRYPNNTGNGYINMNNVPILNNNINLISKTVKVGDTVCVSLTSKDEGVITGIINGNKKVSENSPAESSSKGGYIPNYFSSR